MSVIQSTTHQPYHRAEGRRSVKKCGWLSLLVPQIYHVFDELSQRIEFKSHLRVFAAEVTVQHEEAFALVLYFVDPFGDV